MDIVTRAWIRSKAADQGIVEVKDYADWLEDLVVNLWEAAEILRQAAGESEPTSGFGSAKTRALRQPRS